MSGGDNLNVIDINAALGMILFDIVFHLFHFYFKNNERALKGLLQI